MAPAYCQTTDASLVSYDEAEEVPEGIDVVVDALLGTGMRGQVKAAYRLAVETINAGAAPVLSVDIPSGLDADTGSVLGVAVQANVTVTFIGLKQGLMTNDGPGRAGELVFSDLAVPADIFDEVGPTIQRLVYQELIDDLPKRRANVHKNRFGHVLVVGGDEGMGGAVLMAAEAALRSGAGLVTVATHKSHAGSIINRRPELMVRSLDHSGGLDELLKRATVIALGPGLGRSKWSEEVFNRVMQADLPSVVDADGLNFLAQHPSKRDNWILTPHPGEATNLLGQSLSGSRSVQSDRYAAIRQIQDQYGGVVLLKGLGSIIHSESGTSLSQYGNPGMSTAGMGDVLTGVIAGLLAQDCDPYFAARLGAVVHSLAADQNTQINGERGLMATDLMAGIRRLVNDI